MVIPALSEELPQYRFQLKKQDLILNLLSFYFQNLEIKLMENRFQTLVIVYRYQLEPVPGVYTIDYIAYRL